MATQAEVAGLPARYALVRMEGFPFIPMLILASITFLAVFADVLAPYDPEVGSLGARFRPPAWEARGSVSGPIGDKAAMERIRRIRDVEWTEYRVLSRSGRPA